MSDFAKDTNVPTNDLISRQAAIDVVLSGKVDDSSLVENASECNSFLDWAAGEIMFLPSEPRWIPIKTRPMTEEERQYYSEMYGYDIEYEEAVMFDCKMPEDGQEVWVCSKCGNVWQDTCVVDEGIGLEENGDWLDIVAWMPVEKPDPWSGNEKGERG